MTDTYLPFWTAYFFVALGIAISIALPILRAFIPAPPPLVSAGARPYLAVGGLSLLTALLVVAFNNGQFASPYTALLAGYAWDSTLQKMAGR